MPGKTNKATARNSRREFLASGGAIAAGMYLGGAAIARAAAVETLAVNGGRKAVTAPAGGATSWPLFGDEERKAVNAVVGSPGYAEVAGL